MSTLPNQFWILVSLVVLVGFATPVLAGPTPTPTTPTPPTATPTPPTATPPDPTLCTTQWPITTIITIGKGQKPSANQLVKHEITGHIIDPILTESNAHRIFVCRDSFVRARPFLPTGLPANSTARGTLDCNAGDPPGRFCEGVVSSTERYTSVSDDGSDTDRMQIIPQ